jgi:hypothetical protein
MFAVKRYARDSTPVARPCPQTSSWTSPHAQGYFSATILVLVTVRRSYPVTSLSRHSRQSRALRFELERRWN